MTCRHHREKRHPTCCKLCREDTSGTLPLAPSEIARIALGQPMALEPISAEPPPTQGRWRRAYGRTLSTKRIAVAALVLIACGFLGA